MNERDKFLSTGDLVTGTLIAGAMVAAFWAYSSGLSLILTFIPGAVFAFAMLLLIARSKSSRDLATIGPLFWCALAIQFLHFAEEYQTGFPSQFPVAYGGERFDNSTFIAFNMCAYAIFAVCGVGVFNRRSKRMLMPVLFFAAYGTWGNAVSHLTWCALSGGYFPGAVTAVGYLAIGPLLIRRLIGQTNLTVILLAVEAVVLVLAALYGFDATLITN